MRTDETLSERRSTTAFVLSVLWAYWDERRRLYRLGTIVRAVFDSNGEITRPRYPMIDTETATAFHREHICALL